MQIQQAPNGLHSPAGELDRLLLRNIRDERRASEHRIGLHADVPNRESCGDWFVTWSMVIVATEPKDQPTQPGSQPTRARAASVIERVAELLAATERR